MNLVNSIIRNDARTVKELLKTEDPSDDHNWPIQLASEMGFSEIVKILLDDPRVDPSDYRNYAIQLAAAEGEVDVVKLLIKDPRVDPSADNNFAIQSAVVKGHLEVVKILLKDSRVNHNDILPMLEEHFIPTFRKILVEIRDETIDDILTKEKES